MTSEIYRNSEEVVQRLRDTFCLGSSISCTEKISEEELTALCTLRESLFNSDEGQAAFLDPNRFNEIRITNIDFALKNITLKDPQTKKEYTFHLMRPTSNEVETKYTALNDAISGTRKNFFGNGPTYQINSKGNVFGKEPLKKGKSEVLRAFVKNFKQTASEDLSNAMMKSPNADVRKTLLRRHTFADFFCGKLLGKIREMIRQRESQLRQPSEGETQRSMDLIEKDLKQLTKLRDELQKLDIYALTKVLSHYPVEEGFSIQQLKAVAGEVREEVTHEMTEKKNALHRKKRSLRSKIWNAGKDLILTPPRLSLNKKDKEENAYIKDLETMFFLSRPQYVNFCRENMLMVKKEGVTDLFLREAIAFGKTSPGSDDYRVDGFKESILFEGLSQALKREMDQALDDIEDLANYAITDPVQNLMNQTEIPKDGSDKEKATIASVQKKLLDVAIAGYRESINWRITSADLPEEVYQDAPEPEEVYQDALQPQESQGPYLSRAVLGGAIGVAALAVAAEQGLVGVAAEYAADAAMSGAAYVQEVALDAVSQAASYLAGVSKTALVGGAALAVKGVLGVGLLGAMSSSPPPEVRLWRE
ncbi:MAG: hypothetical protein KR126chlam1_00836 [Chlamydiae bacterium]|nr:hypothetical protein [Chlamydiota bacterium]